ncbi:MAG: hypothetical protein HF982_06970 [Desulfobacteraceae bacterium]|nr:hypothetical protein [Desulfobacteraceae bacterium]MBC2719312.1 hypothetical protein [Desulfobacteraceae bacterium]
MIASFLGWCSNHWQHHSVEICWAVAIGIIVAIPIAILAAIYIETEKGKQLASWLLSLNDWFRKKIRSERNLAEQEVEEAIKSNFPKQIPNTFVADAIFENGALTWNTKWHYTDVEKKYLFPRKFSVLPLINGNEKFYREACRCLASEIEYINQIIKSSDKFLFVYLDKGVNRLFKDQLVGPHFPGKIQCHPIVCDESHTAPRRLDFKYEKGESLRGYRIVLLDCFVLVPELLTSTIKWIQEQGAIVDGVVILFMGAGSFFNENACGINQDNVKIAYLVDLKISKLSRLRSKDKKLKLLTYCNY